MLPASARAVLESGTPFVEDGSLGGGFGSLDDVAIDDDEEGDEGEEVDVEGGDGSEPTSSGQSASACPRPAAVFPSVSSHPSSSDSPSRSSSSSSCPTVVRVAASKSSDAHSSGHTDAVNSIKKWVDAALLALGRQASDLVLRPSLDPDNALASDVLSQMTTWYTSSVKARDVGVDDPREHILERRVPRDNQRLVKCWMRRYINAVRTQHKLPDLPERWSDEIALSKKNARIVSRAAVARGAEDGTIFRGKHDFAPTNEQLDTMTLSGFRADPRVDADLVAALEAGMSVALYLATGARGSELTKLHFQTMGHEDVPHERTGHLFPVLKLTAFELKTKMQHLNQMAAHSNPRRCGVGLLGLSVLVRRKLHGAPPFTMRVDEGSWKLLGSNTNTLERRLKSVFRVSGIRRQLEDPVTYLGRHYGTRYLQHQGGSTEGGAARRGHGDGKTAGHHYTECPLHDLLRLAGNDGNLPFVPAHHQPELEPLADAVLRFVFPELATHEESLETRQREVDTMRGCASDRTRSAEQLCDQEKLARALRFCCRTALCCLVARPRTWRKWAILESEPSLWQQVDESERVIRLLFQGNLAAIQAMDALAMAVRRCEESEVLARRVDPERSLASTVASAVTTAVAEVSRQADEREERLMRQNLLMYESLLTRFSSDASPSVGGSAPSSSSLPSSEPPRVEAVLMQTSAASAPPSEPLAGCRVKHARMAQGDVAHFSSWPRLADAVEYARNDLAPREREEGSKWRRRLTADKRRDHSRDKQWRDYRTLATAVGAATAAAGGNEEAAIERLQARLESFGPRPHTAFLRALRAEHSAAHHEDGGASLADAVLGLEGAEGRHDDDDE